MTSVVVGGVAAAAGDGTLQPMLDVSRDSEDLSWLFIRDASGNVVAHTFAGGFPEALKALARVFDGATLEWRLGIGGGETLSGRIHVPTLEEHQALKTWTLDDIGLTWRVAEDTPDTHVMLPDEAAASWLA